MPGKPRIYSRVSFEIKLFWLLPVLLVFAACFLGASLASGSAEPAYAADTVITVPEGGKGSSAASGTSSSQKSPLGAHRLDAYIGLPKTTLVIATGKTRVRVYKKASVKSKVIGSFLKKSCIVVDTSNLRKGKAGKWLKVKLKGKKRGYVQLSKVTLSTLNTRNFGLDLSSVQNRARAKVCRYALPYLGTRYRLDGNSMKSGIDCCHLVWRAMSKQGYMTSRWYSTHAAHCLRAGVGIRRDELRPGDLVGYPRRSGGSKIVHVGIYLGKGFIVNASSKYGSIYPSGGIRISKINYRYPSATSFRNVIG